jgi:signal peptidase II
MKKFLSLTVLIIILDQITKLFTKNLHLKIFDFLQINYLENTGAVFGILQNHTFLFIILSLIALLTILKFYEKKYWLPYSLITAGIVGNFIDRVSLGYVRDFIDFIIWPVFNIADASICIGVFVLLYFIIKKK